MNLQWIDYPPEDDIYSRYEQWSYRAHKFKFSNGDTLDFVRYTDKELPKEDLYTVIVYINEQPIKCYHIKYKTDKEANKAVKRFVKEMNILFSKLSVFIKYNGE